MAATGASTVSTGLENHFGPSTDEPQVAIAGTFMSLATALSYHRPQSSPSSFIITVVFVITLFVSCCRLLGWLLLFLLVLALGSRRLGCWSLQDLENLFILDLLV